MYNYPANFFRFFFNVHYYRKNDRETSRVAHPPICNVGADPCVCPKGSQWANPDRPVGHVGSPRQLRMRNQYVRQARPVASSIQLSSLVLCQSMNLLRATELPTMPRSVPPATSAPMPQGGKKTNWPSPNVPNGRCMFAKTAS